MQSLAVSQLATTTTTTHRHAATNISRRLPPVSAVSMQPSLNPMQLKHTMPPEKMEVFKALEPWAAQSILPILKPVEECWQPDDFLPDPSQRLDDFTDEIRALQQRTLGLPDEYFVILAGEMITEDALPSYTSTLNTLDEVRDETGSSPNPWATWTRKWAAEENRHGDLLRTYLYLSGRVDMVMVDRTVQYLIGAGTDFRFENNSYYAFVYTSFQERATFTSHGNMARLAKEGGDTMLAQICGTIASDEKRHETAYTRIVEKLLDVDPDEAMVAIAGMLRRKMHIPGHLMYEGQDPKLLEHFAAVLQRLGVFGAGDYADNLEFFITRWRLEKLEGLGGSEAKYARDFVCELPAKIRKLQERSEERARKLGAQGVKFSWIGNKSVTF